MLVIRNNAFADRQINKIKEFNNMTCNRKTL